MISKKIYLAHVTYKCLKCQVSVAV